MSMIKTLVMKMLVVETFVVAMLVIGVCFIVSVIVKSYRYFERITFGSK
jgi:hypothetical protein